VPAGPVASPVIYDELSTDRRRGWFQTMSEHEGQRVIPETPPEWQAATAAAEAVRHDEPTMLTPNGLPVRQPGRRLIPSLAGHSAATSRKPQRPMLRDPDALRRQMSSFESGLGAAGRRNESVSVEESAR
jgi:hypothetical protein